MLLLLLSDRFVQPFRNGSRRLNLFGIEPNRLLSMLEGNRLRLRRCRAVRTLLLNVFVSQFWVGAHVRLFGFLKMCRKGFPGTMQFPAHRVGRLAGQLRYFIVAQPFIGHQQQQQPILFWQGI